MPKKPIRPDPNGPSFSYREKHGHRPLSKVEIVNAIRMVRTDDPRKREFTYEHTCQRTMVRKDCIAFIRRAINVPGITYRFISVSHSFAPVKRIPNQKD